MKRSEWILTLALASLSGGACHAFDTVKTTGGAFSGHIVGMTAVKVELEPVARGSETKEIEVNEIQTILYEGEPTELKTAKKHVSDGKYAEGLAAIERIKQKPSREEIRQDIEFYKALCAAKLALAGSYKITDAGRLMKAFADKHKDSCHYFAASEIVGDLLLAVHQYPAAANYYARLEKAPWPEYKMRAGVAGGRSLLDQGKPAEAIAVFDKVITGDGDSPEAAWQRMAATLGKAGALVALKKPEEAVKIVDEVIKKGDADDAPLMAHAYNALGTAQRQAGHNAEALLAFLRVDQLYPTVADAHAEALANLVELWTERHMIERARRARQTLAEKYKNSPWAKKAGADRLDTGTATDGNEPEPPPESEE